MSKIKKTVMVSIGLTCTGIGVSLLLLTGFGLDPISVFTAGLGNTLSTTVGIAVLVFYFIVIIIIFFIDRHYISMATILSFIIVGPSIDLFRMLFLPVFTPETSIELRLLFFIIAFFSLAFGVALYLSADFGISAADMIPILISDRISIQFGWCKIAFDVVLVIIGIILGGAFGLGTIFIAISTGPTIQFFRKRIERRTKKKWN